MKLFLENSHNIYKQHRVRYHKERKDKLTVKNQLRSLSFQTKMAPTQQYRKTSGPMLENLNMKQYHGDKGHTLHGMRKGTRWRGHHEATLSEGRWFGSESFPEEEPCLPRVSCSQPTVPNHCRRTKDTAEATSPSTSSAHTSFPAQTSLNGDEHVLGSRHMSN